LIWCLSAALAFAGSGGCALNQWLDNGFKVGPNYGKPAVAVASEWIDYRHPSIQSVPADLAMWWTVFQDPALNDLVQTAAGQNINLRVAGMRILEARYRRQIAAGACFPQLQDVVGSYSRNKLTANAANAAPVLRFDNWDLGFNATWELDFWGRFRRAVESTDAELDASLENYDDVLVLLLAEVASSYVEMRTYQERLNCAVKNVTAQENSLKVAEDKFNAGTATKRDVEQARTVLEQTRALVPEFEAGERLANNRLCVLLGFPAQDLAARVGRSPIPQTPPEVAVGIPADLVRRRPDVRRAEREVAAQSARIGIAQSDLYPHITINGTFGYAAASLGSLFDGNRSAFGGIGPAFRWDVLNYGRLVNHVQVQDAKFQQAAYAYREKVLEAGREAEDGIVKFLKSHQRAGCLTASAQAAENTRVITVDQYRQGVVDFTAVFIADSELAQVQDLAAAARGQIAQSLIGLYRALGGGWEMRLRSPGETARGTVGPSPFADDPERRPGVVETPPTPPASLPQPPTKPEPRR
jgi:NodT family efflux transporter outer membrane factor (OMF) lipoprotein